MIILKRNLLLGISLLCTCHADSAYKVDLRIGAGYGIGKKVALSGIDAGDNGHETTPLNIKTKSSNEVIGYFSSAFIKSGAGKWNFGPSLTGFYNFINQWQQETAKDHMADAIGMTSTSSDTIKQRSDASILPTKHWSIINKAQISPGIRCEYVLNERSTIMFNGGATVNMYNITAKKSVRTGGDASSPLMSRISDPQRAWSMGVIGGIGYKFTSEIGFVVAIDTFVETQLKTLNINHILIEHNTDDVPAFMINKSNYKDIKITPARILGRVALTVGWMF